MASSPKFQLPARHRQARRAGKDRLALGSARRRKIDRGQDAGQEVRVRLLRGGLHDGHDEPLPQTQRRRRV